MVWLLPWQLSLAARGELVATRYREAVPVGLQRHDRRIRQRGGRGPQHLRLELVRPLGTAFELGARYTFYTQRLAPDRSVPAPGLLVYVASLRPPGASRRSEVEV